MARYNTLREDTGKGRQTLRFGQTKVVLANGTVEGVVCAPPAPFRIKRVLLGSATATDISGEAEVIVIGPTDDLDTAPAAGNRVIAAVAAFADKKLNDQALTAVGQAKQAAGSIVVLSVTHNGAVVGGDVECIVEYDIVGQTYGAYDGQGDSTGAYD